MNAEVWRTIAAVASGLLVLAGVLYTARSGGRTKDNETALHAWQTLVEPMQTRLGDCERELAAERSWRRLAMRYIETLVRTHHDPPAPPAGLYDNEGTGP